MREGRVELQYYRVNSPQAGVVGDITIRVGDRVTNSTVITTIDDNSALEADIQVPLDRTPDLRVGLPMQLLDANGNLSRPTRSRSSLLGLTKGHRPFSRKAA